MSEENNANDDVENVSEENIDTPRGKKILM